MLVQSLAGCIRIPFLNGSKNFFVFFYNAFRIKSMKIDFTDSVVMNTH